MGVSDTGDRPEIGLGEAYSLETPEDSRRLYGRWAATYETGFVADNNYIYPAGVAAVFTARATVGEGPLLDVGCGTGLVGAALADRGRWVLDGLDISAEMLEMASQKAASDGSGVYRNLHTGDLTARLDLPDGGYGGVVSAGTFTHGHVGPDALDELYRVARSGALFALGVNAEHFGSLGFAERLASDLAEDLITEPEIEPVPIYGAGGHPDDRALVVVFRRGQRT